MLKIKKFKSTNPNEDKTRDDDKPFVLISRPSEVSAYAQPLCLKLTLRF